MTAARRMVAAQPQEQAQRSDPTGVTYEALAGLIGTVGSTANAKLCRTALTSWITVSGKRWSDTAIDLAPANLDGALGSYSSHADIKVLGDGTRNNRRSGLRLLSRLVGDASAAASGPAASNAIGNPFWDAVLARLDDANHLTAKRRKAIRLQSRQGCMPRSPNQVARIANDVGLDPTVLNQWIWSWTPTQLFDLENPNYTWAETHHVLTELRYALSQLPPKVEEAGLPFITWRRASSARTIHLEQLDGSTKLLERSGGWTRRPDQHPDAAPPTERIFREFLGVIFGFFNLPKDAPDPRLRGLGIAAEDLRLTDLFIGSNLVAFCNFQRLRNGRFDHGGLAKLRQDWCLIVGSASSYGRFAQKLLAEDLRKSMSTAGKFDIPETPTAWLAWCDAQLRLLDDWISSETQQRRGKAKYRASRSAEANLERLFEKRRPVEEIVWPTILWLADNRPPSYYPLWDRILHESKIFTIVGFIAEPLRLENWQAMRWGTHLYKRDGVWFLNAKAEEFKNRRALTREYKSRIEASAQPYFESWYRVWMEAFGYDPLAREHRHRVSYVHAATRSKGQYSKPSHGLLRDRLLFLQVVWNITVGPQFFRHLWATDWLKRHPEDYYTVAGKLNDTVATIIEQYGHVGSADHAARADEKNAGVSERGREHLRQHMRKTNGSSNTG